MFGTHTHTSASHYFFPHNFLFLKSKINKYTTSAEISRSMTRRCGARGIANVH